LDAEVIYIEKDKFQTGLFRILFSPLTDDDPWLRDNADKLAKQFITGKNEFGEPIDSPLHPDWSFEGEPFEKEKKSSFQWLIYARKFFKKHVVNGEFRLLKFVWHKKRPKSDGWGPKLVLAGEVKREKQGSTIHYVTKKMDLERAEEIAKLGTIFNHYQPPQQRTPHPVEVISTEHATVFTTKMESGRTLEEHFNEVYDVFMEKEDDSIDRMNELFEQIINLYLQPTIEYDSRGMPDKLPSLGWVEPSTCEWKYLNFDKDTKFHPLLEHEQKTPFLIPIRWIAVGQGEKLRPVTILHGDEWGGNFICPSSKTGSLRPIDFEDAHVHFLKNNSALDNVSYCAPISSEKGHIVGGGKLAHRVQKTADYDHPLPLFRYCAFSALGRIICSLIQKQSQTKSSKKDHRWIELTVSRFFCVLESTLDTEIMKIPRPRGIETFSEKELRQGLIFRTILAAWDWSEHWTTKSRSPNSEESKDFIGKWDQKWLNYFQSQLLYEGRWQYMDKDESGRPAGIPTHYCSILKSHIHTGMKEQETEDFLDAVHFLEEQWYEPRTTQGYRQVTELRDLCEDIEWKENYHSLSILQMKITFINIMYKLSIYELDIDEDEEKISTFLVDLLARTEIQEDLLEHGYEVQSYWMMFVQMEKVKMALIEIKPINNINILNLKNFETYFGGVSKLCVDGMQTILVRELIPIFLGELESISRRLKIANIDDSVLYQLRSALTNVWVRTIYLKKVIIEDIEERNELLTQLIATPSLDLERNKIHEPLWVLDKVLFTIYQELEFYTNNPGDEHYLSENVIHTLNEAMIAFFHSYHQSKTWRNRQERVEMAKVCILEIVERLETLLSVRSEWLNIINDVWNQNHELWEKKKYIQNEAWAAKWQELYLTNNG